MRTSANALAAWVRKYVNVSESTLALTFAEHNSDGWRYNVDENMWLHWVGTHWAKRQTPELLDSLRHFLMTFALAFRQAQRITAAEAVKLQSQRTVGAIEKLCRSLPSFLARADLFDADPFLLCTPGGTVDLRTGDMRASDPGDHITIITPVTPAPVGTKCKRWHQFLDDITAGDKDLQKTLQMWFGISATGTSRDQRILFLYGPGGNGKGVLLRTVSGLIGAHAVNAPSDLLMSEKYSRHATHLINVLNSRMAIATEVDEDATWDVMLIKNITGGDPFDVNRMHKDPFQLLARCSMTVSGNKKPALKGIDDAVKRRFLVATFKLVLQASEIIVDLEKQFIKEEGPAILRWIIDGAVAREKAGKLHVAKVILDDTKDYFEEENILEDFIASALTRVPESDGKKVKTSDVYARWKEFCTRSGRPAGAQNSFTTAMQAAGVTYHRAKDGRYFLNVYLTFGYDGG